MSAQIIPFPVSRPPAPRDPLAREYVRLIHELLAMAAAGVERSDWKAHVEERLAKAYSEYE